MREKRTRGREQFRRHKSLLITLSRFCRIFPLRLRIGLFNCHRSTKGKIGLGLRYVLMKTIAKSLGDNVSIHPDVYILNPQNLSVGNNVSIHPFCYIECGNSQGGISIGDDVSVAHGVTLMATTHTFSDLSVPIKDQQVVSKGIRIGNDVWIGSKATVLAGLSIFSGSIIAAGAVVTQDVEASTVVAGVPARMIKQRE